MATTKSFREMIIEVQNSAEVKRGEARAKWLKETDLIVEGLANGIFLALTNDHVMKDLEEAIVRAAKRSSGVFRHTHSMLLMMDTPTNRDIMHQYMTMARDERVKVLLNKKLAIFVESRKRYAKISLTVSEVSYKIRQVEPIDQLIYEIDLAVAW